MLIYLFVPQCSVAPKEKTLSDIADPLVDQLSRVSMPVRS